MKKFSRIHSFIIHYSFNIFCKDSMVFFILAFLFFLDKFFSLVFFFSSRSSTLFYFFISFSFYFANFSSFFRNFYCSSLLIRFKFFFDFWFLEFQTSCKKLGAWKCGSRTFYFRQFFRQFFPFTINLKY